MHQPPEDHCVGTIFAVYLLRDHRNTCEDLTIRAKEQAERCQLDRVEALVHQCTEAGRKLKASMAELQRGIEVALAEIDKFESKRFLC